MEHDGCESFRAEQEEKGWYRSCADVVTEAWNGQIENIEAMVQEGVIEPSTGSGASILKLDRLLFRMEHSIFS